MVGIRCRRARHRGSAAVHSVDARNIIGLWGDDDAAGTDGSGHDCGHGVFVVQSHHVAQFMHRDTAEIALSGIRAGPPGSIVDVPRVFRVEENSGLNNR